ncbi:unnamed protein product [Brassica napus]|uniref:(rape) hypothetical protein n=1 Tax=Brassica napus TaxID=3708 RepID=A0A816WYI7_BRANA|nr:unnamed protein product [Brassica napus]
MYLATSSQRAKQPYMETMKRAEIDTKAPFRTVKEAVALFGERVLASQVYSSHLKVVNFGKKQMEDPAKIEIELEETKHNLKRAKEESMQVMNSLSSLKEELERTRQELQKLKVDPEGAVKTMDDTVFKTKFEVLVPHVDDGPPISTSPRLRSMSEKRYVKFANHTMGNNNNGPVVGMFLGRHPSMRKKEKKTKTKKKKSLIPLVIGGIFSKKKVLQ